MKYSKIRFGFISVLGVLFITIFILSNYLKLMDAINILATVSNEVLSAFLFVGIAFLTIGIIGIGRLHLKKHKNLFTAIVAVVIPLHFRTVGRTRGDVWAYCGGDYRRIVFIDIPDPDSHPHRLFITGRFQSLGTYTLYPGFSYVLISVLHLV